MAREGLDRKLRAVEAAVSAAMLYDATEEQVRAAVKRGLSRYAGYQQAAPGSSRQEAGEDAPGVAPGSALHRLADAAGLSAA